LEEKEEHLKEEAKHLYQNVEQKLEELKKEYEKLMEDPRVKEFFEKLDRVGDEIVEKLKEFFGLKTNQ